MNPFFNIYIGPMFGAKTTRLLADVDRLKYKGKKVVAFKPNIDKRYTIDKISSHNNGTIEAYCINNAEEILTFISEYEEKNDEKIHTIAVDEAFMINSIDKVLINCFDVKPLSSINFLLEDFFNRCINSLLLCE